MRKKSSIIKVPLPNERMILMLNSNITPNLLNMEGVIVTKAENIGDPLHISIDYGHMEAVRKKEQANLPRKFRLYFKRSKWLLNKPFSKLKEEEIKEAKPLLSAWFLDAESTHLPEFQNCVTAYRNWYNEILNSLIVPWSNGFTEGCNNKTKVLKRVCFGLRNFRRFRSRILHSFS